MQRAKESLIETSKLVFGDILLKISQNWWKVNVGKDSNV